MILNTVDQMGNAYCNQLAALGFDLILSGPPIDSERMEKQASLLRERHQVQTKVIIIDYNGLGSNSYQDIGNTLDNLDICILVNNQTYAVPFDLARSDLLHYQIQACLMQINKHIKCSLLIQQCIVPGMLSRRQQQSQARSAILTLRTHANAVFEERLGRNWSCPVLRSTMAFNSALTQAMYEQFSADIDIMQALTPVVAFESYLSQGLVLEVIMQERLLYVHVRSVLNHLQRGYSETYGSYQEALSNSSLKFLRMRYSIPSYQMFQADFFRRYTQMC